MTNHQKHQLDIWMCNTCQKLTIDTGEHFQLTKHNSHSKVGDCIVYLLGESQP